MDLPTLHSSTVEVRDRCVLVLLRLPAEDGTHERAVPAESRCLRMSHWHVDPLTGEAAVARGPVDPDGCCRGSATYDELFGPGRRSQQPGMGNVATPA